MSHPYVKPLNHLLLALKKNKKIKFHMIPWPLCNLDPAGLSTLISHQSPYSPRSSLHPLMSILQKY